MPNRARSQAGTLTQSTPPTKPATSVAVIASAAGTDYKLRQTAEPSSVARLIPQVLPMLFEHVSIAGLAHIDAPERLTSEAINLRLQPTLQRLGIKTDVLRDVAGIQARRMWGPGVEASDAATQAAEKALADCGVAREKIGVLISTSVSRDFLEPSTASIICGNLSLGENCQNFDVANACLAFLTGMMAELESLECREVVDSSCIPTPGFVFDIMGFGSAERVSRTFSVHLEADERLGRRTGNFAGARRSLSVLRDLSGQLLGQ